MTDGDAEAPVTTLPGVAVDLATGEVLERLNEQPADTLAKALDHIHSRQDELKRWQDALEAELRQRLKIRQVKLAVFGDWEVEASVIRESVWDGDELEPVLQRLVDEGVVRAGDVADVITRTPVVSRSRAKQLASRLVGDAKIAVEATCTWKEKPGKLTVARSVALPEALQAPEAPAIAQAAAKPPEAPDGATAPRGAPQAPPGPHPATVLTPEELFA